MSVVDSEKLVLGKQVDYSLQYDPGQLCPIPRELGRTAAGIHTALLRHGEDIWNIYELSWLAPSGLPMVGMAVVRVPWRSPFLIESKSLKLYCNSFNMTCFDSAAAVRRAMEHDLSEASGASVRVDLLEPHRFDEVVLAEPNGMCVEEVATFAVDRDAAAFAYDIDPSFLKVTEERADEILFSRLFRSRCPVTGQPDWATVRVVYSGPRIEPEGLVRYLVSYRSHQGFHEACVERIYGDILTHCRPEMLEVSARFTRRGGIDINPVRSTHDGVWDNLRDPRQ